MKPILAIVFASLICLPATAQEAAPLVDEPATPSIVMDGLDVDLSQFVWIKRPLVVFADSPADPRFVQQMELLNERLDELAIRDVVVLTDTDPSAQGPLRTKLRPRGFMLALIAKDGTVSLRKPLPWDVREISRSIDKLPMRQQEIKERRNGTHPAS
ncbi:DUF4174 domain-containing protein [Rhodobacteraceae bacterium KMM 6894]|nr:DUF4174 domain-containing protein [Rhodobacteraceae bacterium KMM 6894]